MLCLLLELHKYDINLLRQKLTNHVDSDVFEQFLDIQLKDEEVPALAEHVVLHSDPKA